MTTTSTSTSSTTSTSTTSTSSSTTTTSTSSTTTTTEAPPESSTTTEPVPVEPEFVMTLDGFAAFGVLGDEAQDVLDAFAAEFGDPTADSEWITEHGCAFEGPMRTVTWIEPGVRLTFVDGESTLGSGQHLALYSTVLPVDPPWEMEGVRREMTLEQVQVLFPDAVVLPGPSLDYIQFVPDLGSYAWIDAAGQIREFWAGIEFCGD